MGDLAGQGRVVPGSYLVSAGPGTAELGFDELKTLLATVVTSACEGTDATSVESFRRSPGGRSRPR